MADVGSGVHPAVEEPTPSSRIDPSVPHPARRYDYWLGGKDNFAADRQSGDAVAAAYPAIRTTVIENRRFMQRATRYLTESAGVRQFLDIGTGIPTSPNMHEIAQGVAPESRVVYVDNDPIVLTHARALLTSTPEGATAYVDADLRDPERILDHPDVRATLDLDRPLGLMLVAILHFLTDADDPYAITRRLVDALPSGSYLVVSHATTDLVPRNVAATAAPVTTASMIDMAFRSRDQFAAFFDGLELVPPGITPVTEWQPDDPAELRTPVAQASMYAAVARKP
ncbi:SAM-dependent methyltransferase [Micromonospora sp. DR5-3]|uniref:SAM-dependent methyltransferase n=1 Tax=unclassified Micromonospora TaxID=2617518 RepID=UPI0011DC490B|nr:MULTISPECIES: SAM-dependent methyltransferase [unclassified Micromonospora]MCW3818533.1 SAM-dependent methyltransferase [Micromonospora sp. DR5-3]TYC20294.1 SAM-dependent methyltransferase [Micromonospora sp. MP36]